VARRREEIRGAQQVSHRRIRNPRAVSARARGRRRTLTTDGASSSRREVARASALRAGPAAREARVFCKMNVAEPRSKHSATDRDRGALSRVRPAPGDGPFRSCSRSSYDRHRFSRRAAEWRREIRNVTATAMSHSGIARRDVGFSSRGTTLHARLAAPEETKVRNMPPGSSAGTRTARGLSSRLIPA